MELATFITEHNAPKSAEQTTTLYCNELRTRNTNTFNALLAQIQRKFPTIHSLVSGVDSAPIKQNNRHIALFCSTSKDEIDRIEAYVDDVIKAAKTAAMQALPTTGALSAVMRISDFDDAYVDRARQINAFTPELLSSRVDSINDDIEGDIAYDARLAATQTELSSEACTLARETTYMANAINEAYDGVELDALTALLHDVAAQTTALYSEQRIMSSSPAQSERFALSDLIEQCSEKGSEDASESLIVMRMESKFINDNNRHRVIRDHWESTRKQVRQALKHTMPNLSRKGLDEALTAYHDEQPVSNEPIAFHGIDISHTLSPAFANRLSLRNLAYDKIEQGNSPLNILSGAIVAQIGAFVEMKKTALLVNELYALADRLLAQGTFSGSEGFTLFADTLKRAIERQV